MPTPSLTDYSNPQSIGARLRARRSGPLLKLIEDASAANGKVSILDIGGIDRYWKIVPAGFLQQHRVHITIANIPGAQRFDNTEQFSYVDLDGCDMGRYADGAFDIVHSNSTIEHVGDWSRQLAFADEVIRVGVRYFVQTPNYWFPIEPHCMRPFVHWLPKPTRVWLQHTTGVGRWQRCDNVDAAIRRVDGAQLLSRPMFATLFPNAEIITERVAGLAKSFVAVGSRAGSAA